MKHELRITIGLVILFIVSQLIGLGFLLSQMHTSMKEDGSTTVAYDDVAIGPRPDTQGIGSLVYMIIAIAIGTIVLLVLARFKSFIIWKFWFFIAVWLTIAITLDTQLSLWAAIVLAAVLALWKIFKNNPIIHNLTEILTYTGIAILLVPIFDVFWASILLFAIAVYDMIAVWKSKHMVTLARFQTDSKLFAGMLLPYGKKQGESTTPPKKKEKGQVIVGSRKVAILGGGDIAFPLIFCGTVLQYLVASGITKIAAYAWTLIPVIGGAIALSWLFVKARKDAFYPAMPPLAAGCYIGFLLMWVILVL